MAGPVDNEFLTQAAIYLGATAVAVPLFKRLKLGTILGFLAAGILLGPSGFQLLNVEEGVFHIAELGVVLFLFVIGLELSVSRLWTLKHTIFGLGLLQMLITGLILGYGFYFTGIFTIGPAMIAGFGLACSSTAFALSLMQERRELNSPYGTKAFSVLLFQDLAVIPLLASLPFVAALSSGNGDTMAFQWQAVGKAALVIVGIIILGRYVLNAFFRVVAISGSREAFTAAALFVVAGVSLGVAQVGLSMALGAFLAGVLLAESSFRHQIESDIEPFRELLLGLFFIGVGMQLDLGVVFSSWWIVLCGAVGLILLKGVLLYILTRLFKAEHNNALRVGGVLSQGGEFGFVVFSLGAGQGLFTNQMSTLLSAIITLSMMATPVIMMVITNLIRERSTSGDVTKVEEANPNGSVIIAGFGRMGQVVNQILRNSGVDVTAVDNDPKRIEIAAQFDTKVYFGDVTNVNLLIQAGALNVDAIVFTIDEREVLKSVIEGIRERCPNVKILARVHDRLHAIELLDVEADYLVREMFESSIALGKKTLSYLDFNDAVIEDIAEEFRERDRDRLLMQKAEGLYAKKEDMHKPFEAIRKSQEPVE